MCVFSVTQDSTFKAVNQFRDSILRVVEEEESVFFSFSFSFFIPLLSFLFLQDQMFG